MRVPPAKTIHELGGIWGLGSDSTTVASPNPFHTIGWVVSGNGASGVQTFSETVSREAALTAHTRTNAYLLFREDDLGSLEPGKLADFAILDRDYMTVPEDEIEDLYSVMTVVEGEVVYSDSTE
jgi:predicted amidohydrolase YtcJ